MKSTIQFPEYKPEPTLSNQNLNLFEVPQPAIPAAPTPLAPLSLLDFNMEQPLCEAAIDLPALLSIGRPDNKTWFRTYPYDVCPGICIYEPPGEGRDTPFLLTPEMAELMVDVRKLVVPTAWINPQKVMGLWLLKRPDPSQKNGWIDSAWGAALEARVDWRRISSNREKQQYMVAKPGNPAPPPLWPQKGEIEQMIISAFQSRIIDNQVHPAFKAYKML